MSRIFKTLLAVFLLFFISACSTEKRPFEVKYTSPSDVIVSYQGKQYLLNRYQRNNDVPFQYSFESDGDLDLVIEGKEYEVDSPYDVDKKKKTKKKTTLTKKKKKK